MRVVPPPIASSVLAIAAHPDDVESWCAGTLALAVDAGATVRLLLVTSGDKGSSNPSARGADVAATREVEARAAAAALGLADVAFLRRSDGEVENDLALRADLVAAIRRWRPEVVFTHDPERPWPPYLAHRDHRAVGRAALDAVYPLARDHLSFPDHAEQGLAPHAVGQIWLFASDAPDSIVDVAAGFERKLAARLAHGSQTSDPAALVAGWRRRAAEVGASVGLALAEAFVLLRLDG
jgi:LmbE family N-acetylglucosaminyl deacetylase